LILPRQPVEWGLLNMIVNFGRACRWLLLAVAMLAALPEVARADAGDPPEIEAQRLVHILGYTASDYGGAVANGAITSRSEYDEQLALLADAAKIAARLAPAAPAPAAGAPAIDLVGGVAKVQSLVEAKASEEQVGTAVAAVKAAATNAFHLSEAPSHPPDPMRGRSLYIEHCATCHGQSGRGDTQRALSLEPHPANFHDPRIGDPLTPLRVAGTVRFGINGTAMVPFTFLNDDDRWALGFYVTGLRHTAVPATDSPAYTLSELAVRSDAQLAAELTAAGIPEEKRAAVLSDLRRRAPYENRAGSSPLGAARVKLDRARVAIGHGDRTLARGEIIDAYLEGIEPAEGALRAMDGALVSSLEERFGALRAHLEAGASQADLEAGIAALLADLTRAELLLARPAEERSFVSTAVSSGGILLREGVEAALLIAALLGIASQAGLGDRKRWVHAGYLSALGLGLVTWLVSARLIAVSGARREMVEGVTAVLATVVLFYVSWSLLAKKEVARWMRFLRAQVSPRRAAISLFGVAFLAAYREAFETVLFYQALLASRAGTTPVLVGALGGAIALAALVAIYSRAGKFAPPQIFFKVSSYLLYALAVVFAGQGVAALQMTGLVSIHPLAVPSLPALGLHPTVETCAAQSLLLTLAIAGAIIASRKNAEPAQAAPKPAKAAS
jgi:high-affinity iron transporter